MKERIKNKKGFTLIELLAVIVILGLLMAIAIPSVTKYITESRKKTVTSTIGNYIGTLVNDVNDLSYTFTGTNTVYAVPIECISLERGGTSPFGEWMQANDSYFAYVLIQYDDETSSYTYGFTFKDSAGYGLYPTTQAKLNEQGKQIKTGLNLNRPKNDDITSLTTLEKWKESGFVVDANTKFVVLEATSEGEVGDGKTTCTLCQKGNNYAQVEEEKANGGSNQTNENSLANLIKKNNTIITAAPTLTNSSNNTSDASGLYVSNDTNSGDPTYYFRGDVKNNYVDFAGLKWKIIRINEDGTVRLILDGRVGTGGYAFNSTYNTVDKMYYSNGSNAKTQVESWYKTNVEDKGYDSYVSTGKFCEQAKVKYSSVWTSGDATMEVYSAYRPNFKCSTDGNGKGILSSKAGLITYDEVIHAGGYYGKTNSNYYLYNGNYSIWTMSPAGFNFPSAGALDWVVDTSGAVGNYIVFNRYGLRPVINLNTGLLATGTGTSDDPYVVQTN